MVMLPALPEPGTAGGDGRPIVQGDGLTGRDGNITAMALLQTYRC